MGELAFGDASHGDVRARRASAHTTAHITPEVNMKFKHAVRVRLAATALAATVASPALAQVRIGVGPTVHDPKPYSDRIAGGERRAEQFRGRYQLQLGQARKLLRA
jgi:hypothetical protein